MNEKKAIVLRKKLTLARKDLANSTLRDQVLKAFTLGQALKSPSTTEEDKKAHSDAEKMAEFLLAEVGRRDGEIGALDEEDKSIDNSIKALKNMYC